MITGSLGFIGSNLVSSLEGQGVEVVGLDLPKDDHLSLKRAHHLGGMDWFSQHFCDLTDRKSLMVEFDRFQPEVVVNLAAQAGVRQSVENPQGAASVNLLGFANVLEASRKFEVSRLVYASSSSVYGNSPTKLTLEREAQFRPESFYAATKVANEAMAYSYSKMYGMATTGLRIFTAYGPFGRPDMAIFSFTDKILKGETIDIFNQGNQSRDFTFVDDVVQDIWSTLRGVDSGETRNLLQREKDSKTREGFEIFNVGTGTSTSLPRLIKILEEKIGRKARIELVGPAVGDVTNTRADTRKFDNIFGSRPRVKIEDGIDIFVKWHRRQFPERW